MTIEAEALKYWQLVTKYRRAFEGAGKTYMAHIEIPTFYTQAKNPRINMQLHNIMLTEGLEDFEKEDVS